jgi:hypothetical protein
MASIQEQIAQGSLQSSHRNTHAIVLKKANTTLQQKAIDFLNSTKLDLVIQQRLSADKAETPLKKGTFFIQTYGSKCEPGFLVFLHDSVPVFVKYNLSKKERQATNGQPLCYILRMRTSAKVNEGSVFVASIDTINHKLYLEDIYIWCKQNIFNSKTFLERRAYIKEFVETHWIPDVRLLGGIMVEIIQPHPLIFFESLLSSKDFMKVNFIPNSPGRRRFTLNLNEVEAKIDSSAYYGRVTKEVFVKQNEVSRYSTAKAIRVPILPDVYDLYNNGISLGHGAIQNLSLSKLLKEKNDLELHVKINYNEDFKRYEIVGLIDTP